MKTTYKITITDTNTYIIRSKSEADAVDCALDYFEARMPEIFVEETNEPPEVEI